jgi:ribosomal protein L7/L12
MIRKESLTRDQALTLLGAANRSIESFMDYPYDAKTARSSYKKIQHIKMIKVMFDTDLRTAKDVVDIAWDCWKNEHPVPSPDPLQELRDKLTGNTATDYSASF